MSVSLFLKRILFSSFCMLRICSIFLYHFSLSCRSTCFDKHLFLLLVTQPIFMSGVADFFFLSFYFLRVCWCFFSCTNHCILCQCSSKSFHTHICTIWFPMLCAPTLYLHHKYLHNQIYRNEFNELQNVVNNRYGCLCAGSLYYSACVLFTISSENLAKYFIYLFIYDDECQQFYYLCE